MVSVGSLLKGLFLAYLSKPAGDRAAYRLIRRKHVRSIVEFGLGDARRAVRMIRLAQDSQDAGVSYTGIDLFELRPAQGDARLSLKQVYQRLRSTGARIRLLPGDPLAALTRSANDLTGTDLVVISADQDAASLRRAWFYLPRMLGPQSTVLVESTGDSGATVLRPLPPSEINSRAAATTSRRRAA